MPKLKSTYATLEEIPEHYRDLFEERQEKWILTRIEGLASEADIHRLTTANANLRTENSTLKSKVEKFGDRSLEDLTRLEDENAELKATIEAGGGGKLNEEKVNALVEARIKTRVGPLERELKVANEKLAAEQENTKKLSSKITKTTISDNIRSAAIKVNVVPTALDDIIAMAENVFEVIEVEGKERVVTKDGIGITPGLDPKAYFAEVGPNKPHWFPPSQGAGANGGSGAGGGLNGKNPWGRANWNLTEQGKLIKQEGMDKASQYAKQAGSFVGATEPPAEKK